MSPVIREFDKRGMDYFVIHTGQHYSYCLDGVFFERLNLPEPQYNLHVGSGSYAEEVSKSVSGIMNVLSCKKPSMLLVYGDTNSCLSGALAAMKSRIPIGHLEAGLRSYYSGMPEEINRVIVDHCADLLFSPTENSKRTLLGEGIAENKIYMVGNTVVDALMHNVNYDSPRIAGRYMLATIHRQENVDSKERFTSILKGLELVADDLEASIVYPMHPRARARMTEFGLLGKMATVVQIIEPLDYCDFLRMERHAMLVLTDSGGVQEESCILGTPCVTLRDNTERPETVEIGANMLAGTEPERILECARIMVGKNGWKHPFGDGRAAERIVDIVSDW